MVRILAVVLAVYLIGCGNATEKEKVSTGDLWVGRWVMTGYDTTSVTHRDTLIFMTLGRDESITYVNETRDGVKLFEQKGKYKLNDMKSVLTVYENDKKVVEYFIRKVDQDSLIFQSDSFSIHWKRVE